MNRRPRISNRTALIAILLLALTAFVGMPGSAPESDGMATAAEAAPAEPLARQAGTPRKTTFRLLLLRRG